MEIDFKLIGARIRESRLRKKLTQDQLAEMLDVSIAFLSRIERGNSEVNLKRLAQISKCLDIPIEYLITGALTKKDNYLDKELHDVLMQCSTQKKKLIYSIAKQVLDSSFV